MKNCLLCGWISSPEHGVSVCSSPCGVLKAHEPSAHRLSHCWVHAEESYLFVAVGNRASLLPRPVTEVCEDSPRPISLRFRTLPLSCAASLPQDWVQGVREEAGAGPAGNEDLTGIACPRHGHQGERRAGRAWREQHPYSQPTPTLCTGLPLPWEAGWEGRAS